MAECIPNIPAEARRVLQQYEIETHHFRGAFAHFSSLAKQFSAGELRQASGGDLRANYDRNSSSRRDIGSAQDKGQDDLEVSVTLQDHTIKTDGSSVSETEEAAHDSLDALVAAWEMYVRAIQTCIDSAVAQALSFRASVGASLPTPFSSVVGGVSHGAATSNTKETPSLPKPVRRIMNSMEVTPGGRGPKLCVIHSDTERLRALSQTQSPVQLTDAKHKAGVHSERNTQGKENDNSSDTKENCSFVANSAAAVAIHEAAEPAAEAATSTATSTYYTAETRPKATTSAAEAGTPAVTWLHNLAVNAKEVIDDDDESDSDAYINRYVVSHFDALCRTLHWWFADCEDFFVLPQVPELVELVCDAVSAPSQPWRMLGLRLTWLCVGSTEFARALCQHPLASAWIALCGDRVSATEVGMFLTVMHRMLHVRARHVREQTRIAQSAGSPGRDSNRHLAVVPHADDNHANTRLAAATKTAPLDATHATKMNTTDSTSEHHARATTATTRVFAATSEDATLPDPDDTAVAVSSPLSLPTSPMPPQSCSLPASAPHEYNIPFGWFYRLIALIDPAEQPASPVHSHTHKSCNINNIYHARSDDHYTNGSNNCDTRSRNRNKSSRRRQRSRGNHTNACHIALSALHLSPGPATAAGLHRVLLRACVSPRRDGNNSGGSSNQKNNNRTNMISRRSSIHVCGRSMHREVIWAVLHLLDNPCTRQYIHLGDLGVLFEPFFRTVAGPRERRSVPRYAVHPVGPAAARHRPLSARESRLNMMMYNFEDQLQQQQPLLKGQMLRCAEYPVMWRNGAAYGHRSNNNNKHYSNHYYSNDDDNNEQDDEEHAHMRVVQEDSSEDDKDELDVAATLLRRRMRGGAAAATFGERQGAAAAVTATTANTATTFATTTAHVSRIDSDESDDTAAARTRARHMIVLLLSTWVGNQWALAETHCVRALVDLLILPGSMELKVSIMRLFNELLMRLAPHRDLKRMTTPDRSSSNRVVHHRHRAKASHWADGEHVHSPTSARHNARVSSASSFPRWRHSPQQQQQQQRHPRQQSERMTASSGSRHNMNSNHRASSRDSSSCTRDSSTSSSDDDDEDGYDTRCGGGSCRDESYHSDCCGNSSCASSRSCYSSGTRSGRSRACGIKHAPSPPAATGAGKRSANCFGTGLSRGVPSRQAAPHGHAEAAPREGEHDMHDGAEIGCRVRGGTVEKSVGSSCSGGIRQHRCHGCRHDRCHHQCCHHCGSWHAATGSHDVSVDKSNNNKDTMHHKSCTSFTCSCKRAGSDHVGSCDSGVPNTGVTSPSGPAAAAAATVHQEGVEFTDATDGTAMAITTKVMGYHLMDPLLGSVLATLNYLGLPHALICMIQTSAENYLIMTHVLTLLQNLFVLMDTTLPADTVSCLHDLFNRVMGRLVNDGNLAVVALMLESYHYFKHRTGLRSLESGVQDYLAMSATGAAAMTASTPSHTAGAMNSDNARNHHNTISRGNNIATDANYSGKDGPMSVWNCIYGAAPSSASTVAASSPRTMTRMMSALKNPIPRKNDFGYTFTTNNNTNTLTTPTYHNSDRSNNISDHSGRAGKVVYNLGGDVYNLYRSAVATALLGTTSRTPAKNSSNINTSSNNNNYATTSNDGNTNNRAAMHIADAAHSPTTADTTLRATTRVIGSSSSDTAMPSTPCYHHYQHRNSSPSAAAAGMAADSCRHYGAAAAAAMSPTADWLCEESNPYTTNVYTSVASMLDMDDATFTQMLRNTLLTRSGTIDVLRWNYDQLLLLVQGPLHNPRRLRASRALLNILVAFYTPRDSKSVFFLRPFSTLTESEVTPSMCTLAVELMDLLLSSARDGPSLLCEADFPRAMSTMLCEVRSGHPVILRPGRVNSSVGHTLLHMLGRFSAHATGLQLMHEYGLFDTIDTLLCRLSGARRLHNDGAHSSHNSTVSNDKTASNDSNNDANIRKDDSNTSSSEIHMSGTSSIAVNSSVGADDTLHDVCCLLLNYLNLKSVANYGVCDEIRHTFTVALSNASQTVRLCAVRQLHGAVRDGESSALRWVIGTLLAVLQVDESTTVLCHAIRLLLSVALSSRESLDYLTSLGPRVLLERLFLCHHRVELQIDVLFYKMACWPAGFAFLRDHHWIQEELREWERSRSAGYARVMRGVACGAIDDEDEIASTSSSSGSGSDADEQEYVNEGTNKNIRKPQESDSLADVPASRSSQSWTLPLNSSVHGEAACSTRHNSVCVRERESHAEQQQNSIDSGRTNDENEEASEKVATARTNRSTCDDGANVSCSKTAIDGIVTELTHKSAVARDGTLASASPHASADAQQQSPSVAASADTTRTSTRSEVTSFLTQSDAPAQGAPLTTDEVAASVRQPLRTTNEVVALLLPVSTRRESACSPQGEAAAGTEHGRSAYHPETHMRRRCCSTGDNINGDAAQQRTSPPRTRQHRRVHNTLSALLYPPAPNPFCLYGAPYAPSSARHSSHHAHDSHTNGVKHSAPCCYSNTNNTNSSNHAYYSPTVGNRYSSNINNLDHVFGGSHYTTAMHGGHAAHSPTYAGGCGSSHVRCANPRNCSSHSCRCCSYNRGSPSQICIAPTATPYPLSGLSPSYSSFTGGAWMSSMGLSPLSWNGMTIPRRLSLLLPSASDPLAAMGKRVNRGVVAQTAALMGDGGGGGGGSSARVRGRRMGRLEGMRRRAKHHASATTNTIYATTHPVNSANDRSSYHCCSGRREGAATARFFPLHFAAVLCRTAEGCALFRSSALWRRSVRRILNTPLSTSSKELRDVRKEHMGACANGCHTLTSNSITSSTTMVGDVGNVRKNRCDDACAYHHYHHHDSSSNICAAAPSKYPWVDVYVANTGQLLPSWHHAFRHTCPDVHRCVGGHTGTKAKKIASCCGVRQCEPWDLPYDVDGTTVISAARVYPTQTHTDTTATTGRKRNALSPNATSPNRDHTRHNSDATVTCDAAHTSAASPSAPAPAAASPFYATTRSPPMHARRRTLHRLAEALLCVSEAGSSDSGYANVLRTEPTLLCHIFALARDAATLSLRAMCILCLGILARAPAAAAALREAGFVVFTRHHAYTSVDGVHYAVSVAHPTSIQRHASSIRGSSASALYSSNHNTTQGASSSSSSRPFHADQLDGNDGGKGCVGSSDDDAMRLTAADYTYANDVHTTGAATTAAEMPGAADPLRRVMEHVVGLINPMRCEAAKTALSKLVHRDFQILLIPRVLALCVRCSASYPMPYSMRCFVVNLIARAFEHQRMQRRQQQQQQRHVLHEFDTVRQNAAGHDTDDNYSHSDDKDSSSNTHYPRRHGERQPLGRSSGLRESSYRWPSAEGEPAERHSLLHTYSSPHGAPTYTKMAAATAMTTHHGSDDGGDDRDAESDDVVWTQCMSSMCDDTAATMSSTKCISVSENTQILR